VPLDSRVLRVQLAESQSGAISPVPVPALTSHSRVVNIMIIHRTRIYSVGAAARTARPERTRTRAGSRRHTHTKVSRATHTAGAESLAAALLLVEEAYNVVFRLLS